MRGLFCELINNGKGSMKNRHHIIILSALSILSGSAKADDTLAMKTVQELYHSSLKVRKHTATLDRNALLEKVSTAELQKLFKADHELVKRTGELGCIDYDLMWLTDGQVESAPLSFKAEANNQVTVHIGESKGLKERSLSYQMQCDTESCKVSDLFLENDVSFKRILGECLSIS